MPLTLPGDYAADRAHVPCQSSVRLATIDVPTEDKDRMTVMRCRALKVLLWNLGESDEQREGEDQWGRAQHCFEVPREVRAAALGCSTTLAFPPPRPSQAPPQRSPSGLTRWRLWRPVARAKYRNSTTRRVVIASRNLESSPRVEPDSRPRAHGKTLGLDEGLELGLDSDERIRAQGRTYLLRELAERGRPLRESGPLEGRGGGFELRELLGRES